MWVKQFFINSRHAKLSQVNSYAPLGTPDIEYGNWDPLLPEEPTAQRIGQKYEKTASQVWLRWALEQSVVVNPRSWNESHMADPGLSY